MIENLLGNPLFTGGIGLLSGGGPSRDPVSFGQALGQGLKQAQEGVKFVDERRNNQISNALQLETLKLQQAQQRLAREEFEAEAAATAAETQRRLGLLDALGSVYTDPNKLAILANLGDDGLSEVATGRFDAAPGFADEARWMYQVYHDLSALKAQGVPLTPEQEHKFALAKHALEIESQGSSGYDPYGSFYTHSEIPVPPWPGSGTGNAATSVLNPTSGESVVINPVPEEITPEGEPLGDATNSFRTKPSESTPLNFEQARSMTQKLRPGEVIPNNLLPYFNLPQGTYATAVATSEGKITAKVNSRPTELQVRALGFANKMSQSEAGRPSGQKLDNGEPLYLGGLSRYEENYHDVITDWYEHGLLATVEKKGGTWAPGAEFGYSFLEGKVSPEMKTYVTDARVWISGLLRYESGAAVPETEFWRYFKTYFAASGDSPAVVAQKREARKAATKDLHMMSNPQDLYRFSLDDVNKKHRDLYQQIAEESG